MPSSASVAWPLNEIKSPAFQVSVAAGESITGTGGVFDAETVTDVTSVAPAPSVTRAFRLCGPFASAKVSSLNDQTSVPVAAW